MKDNAVKKNGIDELQAKVKAAPPVGWSAYVTCFLDFSSFSTTPDFISVEWDTKSQEWKEFRRQAAQLPMDQRKTATTVFRRAQAGKAQDMGIALRSKGFMVKMDGSSVYVTGTTH